MRHFRHAAWIKALLSLLFVALLALGLPVLAQAHAELLRSDPPDNSVLDESPGQIRMWFSEAIIPDFSSAQILDTAGSSVSITSIQFDSEEPTLMVVEIPVLAQGIYSVNWSVNSAADGHISRGYLVFSIGDAAGGAGSAPPGQETGLRLAAILDAMLLGLNYLALILIIGVLGILLFVLTGPEPGDGSAYEVETVSGAVRARVRRLGWFGTGLAILVSLALLAWQVGSLVNMGTAGSSIPQVLARILTRTPWGYAWLAREGFLLILLILFSRLRRQAAPERGMPGLALAAAVCALVAQSMVSHAAGAQNAFFSILVNVLHFTFAGFWIGGLAALFSGYLPLLLHDRKAFMGAMRAGWGNFGRLAALSVGVVIATGLYSTGVEVISADALLLSPYGRVLSLKVFLVLIAGLLGLANSILLHPGLASPLARLLKKPRGWVPVPASRFPRLVVGEVLAGLAIVLLVGVLTTNSPALDKRYIVDLGGQADDVVTHVDDLSITLSVKPNRPGQNLITVKVLDSRRPPPAETLRVIVRMTYLDQEIGMVSQDAEPAEDDGWQTTYRAVNNDLIQPGRWEIEVVVRRKGIPDSKIVIPWTVSPLEDTPAKIVSRTPWKTFLTILSGAAGFLVLTTAGLLQLRKHSEKDTN